MSSAAASAKPVSTVTEFAAACNAKQQKLALIVAVQNVALMAQLTDARTFMVELHVRSGG